MPYEVGGFASEGERFRNFQALHAKGDISYSLLSEEGASQDLVRLVRLMLDTDPKKRISLSRVIGELRAIKEREFLDTYATVHPTVQPNRYRWNPSVHVNLDHSLSYYLIRSRSPVGDLSWLTNNLNDANIDGYALYRLLGGHDYLLRTWTDAPRARALTEMMGRYRSNQNGSFRLFQVDPEKSAPFWTTRKQAVPSDRQDLVEALLKCVSEEGGDEFSRLEKSGFVGREPLRTQKGIRFFLFVRFDGETAWPQLRGYMDTFRETLNAKAKRLSAYAGPPAGYYHLLFRFQLPRFHDYQPLMDQLLAQAVSGVHPRPEFETFVELDLKGVSESDDGPILAVLGRYAKHQKL